MGGSQVSMPSLERLQTSHILVRFFSNGELLNHDPLSLIKDHLYGFPSDEIGHESPLSKRGCT
jgi:hypothetical protein